VNVITSVRNFMKIYLAVQKLLVGDTQANRDRQTGDLIKSNLIFESTLKKIILLFVYQ
jgi:hypothetical protein